MLCVQADLKAPLPLADGAFDRVLCHNVLEVLPDPGALVAEVIGVLRPGGWPGYSGWTTRRAFLFSVNDYAVICGRMPR